MKLKHIILKHLIENKDKSFSIREISKILKKDYKNTYDAVSQIKDSVIIEKKSNSSFVKFKAKLTLDVYEVEKQRSYGLKLGLLAKDLKGMNPFFVAVVFGSYAKGKNAKNSDIDICLIGNKNKNVKSALKIHPKVEIQDFTYEEFISMLESKKVNVGHEIFKDGIVIHGLESYYEMIKHA